MYRLGVLSPIFVRPPTGGPDSRRDTFLELTLQDLRDRGYIEPKSLMVEHRSAKGHVERLPELAAELVRLHVDVILAEAAPAIHAALTATTTIPIVMITGDDPVRSGFVASLGRPGGNITGVTILARDLAVKRLEFLDGPRLLPLSTAHRSLANGIRLEGNGGGRGAHSLRAELLEPAEQVATFIDRILKGTRPADLPVEEPAQFQLVVNMKVAKSLGLVITQSLLARADQVIE